MPLSTIEHFHKSFIKFLVSFKDPIESKTGILYDFYKGVEDKTV